MDESVKVLKELVSIPSVTGDTDDAVEYLKGVAAGKGMEAIVENGALVINPDANELLLLGHIDTVPGTPKARIDNEGRLWGRGSVDAKGPFCSALFALSKRKDLHSGVKIIAVPDEEGDSGTAYRIRDSMEPIPTVILEPSGSRGITISYRGRMVLEIKATTSRSHSGAQIPFASEVLLDRIDDIRFMTGGRILEISGDIETARALVDLRYESGPEIPGKDDNIVIRILENIPPMVADRNNPLVRSFLRAFRKMGCKPVFKRKTGTCDMNILGEKWDVPMMAYGPGEGKLDHTEMEHISLDEYRESIDIWSAFLKEYFMK